MANEVKRCACKLDSVATSCKTVREDECATWRTELRSSFGTPIAEFTVARELEIAVAPSTEPIRLLLKTSCQNDFSWGHHQQC